MISTANSPKAELQKMFHELKSMFVSICFLKTSPGSLSLIEIRIINLSDWNKVFSHHHYHHVIAIIGITSPRKIKQQFCGCLQGNGRNYVGEVNHLIEIIWLVMLICGLVGYINVCNLFQWASLLRVYWDWMVAEDISLVTKLKLTLWDLEKEKRRRREVKSRRKKRKTLTL